MWPNVCLPKMGALAPDKRIILPKSTLVNWRVHWVNYRTMGDSKAECITKKPTTTWEMTHESCIPEAPCGTCRWAHQRASSYQLFTALITSGPCESCNFLSLGAFYSLLHLINLFLQSVMVQFGGGSYPALNTTAFILYPWLYLNTFNKVGREYSKMQVFRISLGMVPVSDFFQTDEQALDYWFMVLFSCDFL